MKKLIVILTVLVSACNFVPNNNFVQNESSVGLPGSNFLGTWYATGTQWITDNVSQNDEQHFENRPYDFSQGGRVVVMNTACFGSLDAFGTLTIRGKELFLNGSQSRECTGHAYIENDVLHMEFWTNQKNENGDIYYSTHVVFQATRQPSE